MRLLLDTHVLVWWMVEPDRLPRRIFEMIADEDNAPTVSAVSGYEIELKRSRDPILARLPHDLERAVRDARFDWAEITPAHAIQAGRLPLHHRDPGTGF